MGALVTAGEVKNWFYCQRIVYYRRLMPGAAEATFKMEEALRAQDMIERLESRRTLSAYGVEGYHRRFGVWLSSPRVGANGKLDLLLESAQGPARSANRGSNLSAPVSVVRELVNSAQGRGARRETEEEQRLTPSGAGSVVREFLESGGDAIPVDFKLTSGEPGENHRMQLALYALLVEEVCGLTVDRGLLYRIPDDQVYEIILTGETKQRAQDAVHAIGQMQMDETFPEATAVRGRCRDCEYSNFCGDVW